MTSRCDRSPDTPNSTKQQLSGRFDFTIALVFISVFILIIRWWGSRFGHNDPEGCPRQLCKSPSAKGSMPPPNDQLANRFLGMVHHSQEGAHRNRRVAGCFRHSERVTAMTLTRVP